MNVFGIINKILTMVQIVMWLFEESIHLKLKIKFTQLFMHLNDLIKVKSLSCNI